MAGVQHVEDPERPYHPSRWVKRLTADEVIQHHLEFITKGSQTAVEEIPCELDVAYGDLNGEKFDIFGTNLPDEAPIIIYIHGGYWQELSRNLSRYVAKAFYKNGMKVIIMGYDLCPTVSLPQIVEEIRKGICKCLEYAANKNSAGVFLAGHSAGAHLAVSIFMKRLQEFERHKDLVKAVFLLGGVYNLEPLVNTSINDALKLTKEMALTLSPLHQQMCWGEAVRFYVLVGEHDSPLFIQQSKLFHQKLRKDLKYPADFVLIENVDHFNIVENLTDKNFEITALILSLMEDAYKNKVS